MKFSLYRGNLHKVPDIPRRWPLFRPSMSLQVFQKALARRQEALNSLEQNPECYSSLKLGTELICTSGVATARKDALEGCEQASPSNERNSSDEGGSIKDNTDPEDGGGSKTPGRGKRKRDSSEFSQMEIDGATAKPEEDLFRVSESERDVGELPKDMAIDGGEKCDEMDCDTEAKTMGQTSSMAKVVEKAEGLPHAELVKSKCQISHVEKAGGPADIGNCMAAEESCKEKDVEKLEAPRTPVAMDEECTKPSERATARLDSCACPSFPSQCVLPLDAHRAKKKAELEEKLKQLQETKHQLVQMLKQVLTSEEESRRKAQGVVQFSASCVSSVIIDGSLEHKTRSNLEQALKDVEEFSCLH